MNKQYFPISYSELLTTINELNQECFFYAGGTDIMVLKNRKKLPNKPIIHINQIAELNYIKINENEIEISALTTFLEVINNDEISKKLPFLSSAFKEFASPLLQSLATIVGNIANGSPTADSVPVLLALNAKLVLSNFAAERVINLTDFYTSYKQNILQKNEIIKSIIIENAGISDFYYRKVGTRKSLSIAKINLVIAVDNSRKIRIAVGSLNEFPRRLSALESYIEKFNKINENKIKEFLKNEITPITDFRSDAEYRFGVTFNLLKEKFKELGIYEEL